MAATPQVPERVDLALLHRFGLRIEGPGAEAGGSLASRDWWTWFRPGWGGIECGPPCPSAEQAMAHAWQTLWNDEDHQDELQPWRNPIDPGKI